MFPGVVSLLQEVTGARGRGSDTSLSRPFQSKNAQPWKRGSSQKALFKERRTGLLLAGVLNTYRESPQHFCTSGGVPSISGGWDPQHFWGKSALPGEAFNTSRSVQFPFRLDFNLFCKSTYELRGLLPERGFIASNVTAFQLPSMSP